MFYTQLEAAKKGFVTDAMKIVAEKERVPVERIRELVSLGPSSAFLATRIIRCIDAGGDRKGIAH